MMQATRIGNITITNPRRMAGTYQSAYEVTTESGQMGLVLYVYEYDCRDVVEELVFVEPNIADEVKNMIDDESPSCSGMFSFPEKSEENQNPEKISIAMEKATSLVYGTGFLIVGKCGQRLVRLTYTVDPPSKQERTMPTTL